MTAKPERAPLMAYTQLSTPELRALIHVNDPNSEPLGLTRRECLEVLDLVDAQSGELWGLLNWWLGQFDYADARARQRLLEHYSDLLAGHPFINRSDRR